MGNPWTSGNLPSSYQISTKPHQQRRSAEHVQGEGLRGETQELLTRTDGKRYARLLGDALFPLELEPLAVELELAHEGPVLRSGIDDHEEGVTREARGPEVVRLG